MNKFLPHLCVLCEDDINFYMVEGFIWGLHQYQLLNPSPIEPIREVAGGWNKAIDSLENSLIQKLQNNQNLFLLLLIDSDGFVDRINKIKLKIPNNFIDRVFVIGCFNEPEILKKQSHSAIKQMNKKTKVSNEAVGQVLFQHCKDNPKNNLWYSDELKHNLDEIERLKEKTKHFINWP